MKQIQSMTAVLCVWLMGSAPMWERQDRPEDTTPRLNSDGGRWYDRAFTRPYQSRIVPPVNVSNTTRLDGLLRGGNLYLSLTDAIALGIENNLDIEVQRYEFDFADADLLRARSGAAVQGIPTNVTSGTPTGVAGILGNLNTGITSSGANTSLPLGFTFDPFLTANVSWGHITTPVRTRLFPDSPTRSAATRSRILPSARRSLRAARLP